MKNNSQYDISYNTAGKIFVACLLFIISLEFLNSRGTGDVNIWLTWLDNAVTKGLVTGYHENAADYPPLSSAITYFFYLITSIFTDNYFVSIKISIMFFLFLTATVFYRYTDNFYWTTLIFISLFISSITLGYTDIYFAPFFIGAVFAVKNNRIVMFSLLFTVALFIKWQPLIVLPFFIAFIAKQDTTKLFHVNNRNIFQMFITMFGVTMIITSFFGFKDVALAFHVATHHEFLSANALNFNWLLTYYLQITDPKTYGSLSNGLTHYIISNNGSIKFSRIIFFTMYSLLFLVFTLKPRKFAELCIFSAVGYLMYFTFNTGAHENHLFMAIILFSILAFENSQHLPNYIFVAAMSNINLVSFYGITGQAPNINKLILGNFDSTLFLSFANVLFALWLFYKLLHQEYKNFKTSSYQGNSYIETVE